MYEDYLWTSMIDFSKAFREVILVDDGARGSSGKEEMEAKLEEGWDGIFASLALTYWGRWLEEILRGCMKLCK